MVRALIELVLQLLSLLLLASPTIPTAGTLPSTLDACAFILRIHVTVVISATLGLTNNHDSWHFAFYSWCMRMFSWIPFVAACCLSWLSLLARMTAFFMPCTAAAAAAATLVVAH